jgi:hypothetical protein
MDGAATENIFMRNVWVALLTTFKQKEWKIGDVSNVITICVQIVLKLQFT